jgi:hypothetical protein
VENGLIALGDHNDTKTTQIFTFTMSEDGSNRKQLTFGSDGHWMPAWSPDGKTILFPACPDFSAPPGCPGGDSLSVGGIGPDGSNRRILFKTNGDFGRVSWQPVREGVSGSPQGSSLPIGLTSGSLVAVVAIAILAYVTIKRRQLSTRIHS